MPAERNLFALVKNAALALRIHCDAGRFDEVFFREHREEVGIRLVIQLWYGPQGVERPRSGMAPSDYDVRKEVEKGGCAGQPNGDSRETRRVCAVINA